MYLNHGTINITHLQNGNVLYNNEEKTFKDLPREVIFALFEQGHTNSEGKEMTNDDWLPIFLFIQYAETQGIPFPFIPPQSLFDQREEETRFYKSGPQVSRQRTVKIGLTAADNLMLNQFEEFVKHYGLMTETEWGINKAKWEKIIENHETEKTVIEREVLKDKHGHKIIDWTQQKKQDQNNKLIRLFYGWLSDWVE